MENGEIKLNKKEKITKRKIQAQETRKKLFDVAVKLFNTYGYHNVTVDDITDAAETSKGAFYFHFKSKESVIIEAIREVDAQYRKWYETLDKGRVAADQILLFSDQVLTFANSLGVVVEKVLYSSQINEKDDRHMLLNDENRDLFKILECIIESGQRTGEIRLDLSAKDLSRYVARWIRGVIFNWCIYDGAYDLVEDGRAYLLAKSMEGKRL